VWRKCGVSVADAWWCGVWGVCVCGGARRPEPCEIMLGWARLAVVPANGAGYGEGRRDPNGLDPLLHGGARATLAGTSCVGGRRASRLRQRVRRMTPRAVYPPATVELVRSIGRVSRPPTGLVFSIISFNIAARIYLLSFLVGERSPDLSPFPASYFAPSRDLSLA
jgi:hypothetical protein